MIDLTKLPAHEAESIAYAEGFAAAAQLFAHIHDLELEMASAATALRALKIAPDNKLWDALDPIIERLDK